MTWLRIIFTFMLACLVALYVIQNQHHIIRKTEKKFLTLFNTYFDCKATGTLSMIDFFSSRLQAHNVCVHAPNSDKWCWTTDHFKLHSPLNTLFITKKLGLDISLNRLKAYSLIENGTLAIVPHLKKLFIEAANVPVFVRKLTLHDTEILITDPQSNTHCLLQGKCQLKGTVDSVHLQTIIAGGALDVYGYQILRDLFLRIMLHKTPSAGQQSDNISLHAEGSCMLPRLSLEDPWHIQASLQNNLVICSIQNTIHPEHIVSISYDLRHDHAIIKGVINIQQLIQLLGLDNTTFLPTCSFQIEITNCTENPQAAVSATIAPLISMPNNDHAIIIDAEYKNKTWHGNIVLRNNNNMKSLATGHMSYDLHAKSIALQFLNTDTIVLADTQCAIAPGNLQLHMHGSDIPDLKGSLSCIAKHQKSDTNFEIQGSGTLVKNLFKLEGTCQSYYYSLDAQLADKKVHCMLTDVKKNKLIEISSSTDNHLKGTINIALVQQLLEHVYGFSLRGQGFFNITCTKFNPLHITLQMHDGHIQIPSTYNFVKEIESNLKIDWHNKQLVLHNTNISCHKGIIRSKRAVVSWESQPYFIHIPLFVDRLFFNMQKDMFATLSAALLAHQNKEHNMTFDGTITIDRAEYKKNIFSAIFSTTPQKFSLSNLPSWLSALLCNLHITHREPMHIETSFLQTNLGIDIYAHNRIDALQLSGGISLLSGKLNFPYRPLYITNGHLYLLPQQLDDCALELTAKGTIKKHHIILRVTGTVQQPQISLESTPPLTEEQIITLLLAGSHSGSLALIMPTLIMQQLQQLLFGPEQSASKLESYFKSLLKPLQHMRIVPSFFDQTARGGFRGAIEVEVSDQLRGSIQKNFSLTEDTKLEVEYDLSDDISVRAMKDERGDVGGEVEMRWKF